tara:strand:- start:443 stop:1705 length:1263 start_codon:yes stop_codon:yes gene_type:complete
MKKKFLAHTFASDDVKKDFLLYENLYRKVCKNFNKFYFINLINIIDDKKSKNDNSFIKKNFPKNLIIFTPKNFSELKFFLRDKEIITFISLGRELKYFKTLYILKKFNCKIMINLSIGYTGQTNFSVNYKLGLTQKLNFFFKYFLNKKLIWVLFRFLVLINIFPKVEILFDGSKKNIKTYQDYLFHKLKKKIPFLNLSYIKEVRHVTFRSYEILEKHVKNLEEKYIVFLDSGLDHGDTTQFENKKTQDIKCQYYFSLEKVLSKISKIYKKKIIICLHPKTDKDDVKKYIKNISIKQHQTSYYIKKSYLVAFHDSSSILDAIFLRKKIINLRSSLMGDYYKLSNKKYSKLIKIPVINLSNQSNLSKKYIDIFFKNKKKLYKNYLNNFLTFDLNKVDQYKNKEELKGSTQIISIIKEKFLNP